MKLQFKEQQFQVDAVSAITDCFVGQEKGNGHFTLERSKQILQKAKQAAAGINTLQFTEDVDENIGYRNKLLKITDSQLLQNIQKVQQQNDIRESEVLERPKVQKKGINLTIEMETGTGKTYTYIRTMYELHKQYGWSKFIIIVPSVAIREGVYKSFEVTQTHFQEKYGHRIKPFIYNSSKPTDIENFASDSRISVMIINTQAFNARGKDARRIYAEIDSFQSRRPIDIIAQTNPILIIDEPQSVDGVKTLASMQDFNPLFTIRYSATHKEEYNKVYRLDALDAYGKKLVKKIHVKGINLKGSTGTTGYVYLEQIAIKPGKPPVAIIEYEKRQGTGVKRKRERLEEGANLFELSGEMPQYKNCLITDISGASNTISVNGVTLQAGDAVGDLDEKAFRRIQIRETILSHLQKEKELFSKDIKVLSLFFIDTVDKYRKYDENGEQVLGEYAEIFEEEYNKLKNDFLDLFQQDYNDFLKNTDPGSARKAYFPSAYAEFLDRDKADEIHNGYFSIDKKKKFIDPSVKRGKEDSDDISAYDLIMKDKERLLSMNEPTRFIFSHSALKEGWDNPNVFQICALKHTESASKNRRRQEVGRGMRLCVEGKNGIRQDYDTVGDAVHSINKLTIIASESYEDFAKGLQSEIAATLKDRPQKAEVEFFIGKMVTDAMGVEMRIDKDVAKKLNKILYKNDIIDEDDRITEEGKKAIEDNTVTLPENLEPFRSAITKLLKSVYTGEMIKPENDRDKITVTLNKNFHKKEFQELWKRINIKTIYEVKFNSEKLISDSVIRLNADLYISDRVYEIKTGFLKDSSKEELQSKEGFKQTNRESKKLNADLYTDTVYDIVGEIVNVTNLTRRSIVAVLKKMSPQKFALLRKNPEEFIAKSGGLINEVKASLILNHISYYKTEERYDAKTVFTNEITVDRNSEEVKNHIYDYIISDSNIEKEFADALSTSTAVSVFAKLPKDFYITIPTGRYSPDWAIVFEKEKVREIYFVAETKGSDKQQDLRGIEALKIHCAEEHFKEIGNGEVHFAKIKDYEKMTQMLTFI
ncbi:restriction endonuclease subunit R [Polaribacter sp. SA4-10]|uniref:type III restriction-modification system endonuclease n=1 Tax=Polaribacter sp. SA4-10 TaxID=754397 RepID=UPI000B3CA204|nr:DEAD/DEAH box helicase family protein [Polaribacter sp. SA4-10]ARV07586.1 restriction endonuclease subunit R [Polaribacter sp. SA4-10]